MTVSLRLGDCLDVLRTLPDNSVDSIVTDPPYGLAFMGKRWDYDVPSVGVWAECLRVLKPGGHLLAFAGTRTQHRMAVRIEDAGFEIRDMIAWLYGSGFPKSLDVSKAIDKRGGQSHLTAEVGAAIKAARMSRGVSIKEADTRFCGGSTLWTWYEGRPAGQQMPTAAIMRAMADAWPELDRYAVAIAEAEREVVGVVEGSRLAVAPGRGDDRGARELHVTAAATEAARQWSGWGTALKPALEPITVARKPLTGTVAANVQQYGTGALNIDGCRVGVTDEAYARNCSGDRGHGETRTAEREGATNIHAGGGRAASGRWPANVIHDGSEEVLAGFPANAGGGFGKRGASTEIYGGGKGFTAATMETVGYGDAGSAARFFYCAKASRKDRGADNVHPTVKPTDLMRYLCRLVTPPGGIVLDPFMGSGSTGKAATLEGFGFIGIEREADYLAMARARIEAVRAQPEPIAAPEPQPDLFGAVA